MKIPKLAASVLAAGMFAALFTGCGDSAPANKVHSADDLKGKTIGVQLGTTGDILYAGNIEDATVKRFNKAADAVSALQLGEIDAVIIDNEPAEVFVQSSDDLQILPEPFAQEEYAIAVKKGNNELTEKLNGALAEIRADGTLDNIEKNWIGDEAGQYPYVSPEGTSRENGILVMATNPEFAPFESMSGDVAVGYDIDMAQALCDRLGMELQVESMAFASIIDAVDSGKADIGVAAMTVTAERLESVNFTDSYYKSAAQVIVVRKD